MPHRCRGREASAAAAGPIQAFFRFFSSQPSTTATVSSTTSERMPLSAAMVITSRSTRSMVDTLRHDRADMSVVADLEEGVENMLVGCGGQIGLVIARPDAPRQCEATCGGRADQQRTAADMRQARFIFPHYVANTGHRRR